MFFLVAEPDDVNVDLEDDLLDGLADLGSLNDGRSLGWGVGAVTLEREDIGLGIDDIGVCTVDSVELITVARGDITWDLDVGLALGSVHYY